MHQNIKRTTHYSILALLFVATAAIILFIFPSTPKFKYDFLKGKPWSSELLTAPFDFPIYKTDTELQQETTEKLNDYVPYYKIDTSLASVSIKKFDSVFAANYEKLRADSIDIEAYTEFVHRSLNRIYTKGVVASVDIQKMKSSGLTTIALINGNQVTKVSVQDLLTPQQQYQDVVNSKSRPDLVSQEELKRLNLNEYIAPNVSYDERTSQRIKEDILENISLYRGKVQKGEKIVDKGEVLGDQTFNILNSLKKEYPAKMGDSKQRLYIYVGNSLIILFACSLIFFYLYFYHADILLDYRKVVFILGNVVFMVLMARLPYIMEFIPVYALPFVVFPVIFQTLFDSRTAIPIYVIVIILIAAIIPLNSFNFIMIQTFTGMVAVYGLRKLSRRSDLFVVSAIVLLGYSLSYLGVELTQERSLSTVNWSPFIHFAINAGLLLFAYPLIFVYEKIFGFVSDVTLMELSDTNHDLLRRLSEEAPGTFQHSIQVSNLAQAAASAIDANPLLVRTGALFHDIGKLMNPIYFTENQGGLVSPHDELSYEESAKIIINHVSDGVKMAEKHNIPHIIIDFIKTHHGTGKAMYFYTSYKNKFPDQVIDEAVFTYPGPMPNTKETAILMMADCIEATSRSLPSYTSENINELVDRIIDGQLNGGCFQNTPLTFRDVQVVKNVFKEKLKTMYHTRVQYPTANSGEKEN